MFCLRTWGKVSYLLMYKGAEVMSAYLIQKGEYNEYCQSFLTILFHERSKNLHSQKSKCLDMQVTKLHSSFTLNHQQQAGALRKCCKKNMSNMTTALEQISNTSVLFKHWNYRGRETMTYWWIHVLQRIHSGVGLFKATLHKHMLYKWGLGQVYIYKTSQRKNTCWHCTCTYFCMSQNTITKFRFSYRAICAMLQAVLKYYGCKVKHSRHSSNQVTCTTLICHIRYIRYNTRIDCMTIDYFSMWIYVFHLVHMTFQG